MSVLNKLKNIKTAKAAEKATQLHEGPHPLAGRTLDERLQYLAALALLTALDREPVASEVQAFTYLASALGVDEAEARNQLQERTNVGEDDIETLFAAVVAQQARWLYLTDLAWLHGADGDIHADETTALHEAANLLQWSEPDPVGHLHGLMLAVRNDVAADFLHCRSQMPQDAEIQAALEVPTQKIWPVLEKGAVDFVLWKKIINSGSSLLGFGFGLQQQQQQQLQQQQQQQNMPRTELMGFKKNVWDKVQCGEDFFINISTGGNLNEVRCQTPQSGYILKFLKKKGDYIDFSDDVIAKLFPVDDKEMSGNEFLMNKAFNLKSIVKKM